MSKEERHNLRQQAEEIAQGVSVPATTDLADMSAAQVRRALHELRVHQIELEMQNEELRRTQAELETARSRYFDLYDLAPVGYCTLSEQGLIVEANFTAAELLGVAKNAMIRQPFTRFVLAEDQDAYYLHRRQLLAHSRPQVCELRMIRPNGTTLRVRLDAKIAWNADGEPVCRVVLNDMTEYERAQALLRESEQRHQAILETAMDGFLVADMGGRLLEANETYCRMSGYSKQELLAMRITDVEALESAEETAAHIKQALVRSEDRFESAHRRKDGSVFDVEIGVQYRNVDGGRIVAFLRDITERKRTENALHAAEEQFRTLFEGAPEGILVADPNSRRFLDANPAICRMLGYSESELLQLSVRDIHPPEHLARVGVEFDAQARGEMVRVCDVPCLRKDRSIFHVDVAATRLTIAGRQTLVGFFTDITERKRAEAALRESIELLSLYISHSPIYAFIKLVTPTESRVLHASDNYLQMIGIAGRDMVGKTMAELFPPEFAARITADDWSVVTSGKVLQLDEELNGRNYTTIKFPIVQGDRTLLAGYTIDITDRHRLEAQLLQAQKLEAIGQLAGGIAHDFRNQLTVIAGYSEVLLRDSLVKAGHETLAEQILKAADRGTQLTSQLLAFSRKDMLVPSVANLGQVVADLIGPMSRLVGEDIVVSTTGAGPDLMVDIAAIQFQHTMMNLAANSRDAMPRGGRLSIDLACVDVDEALAAATPDAHVGPYVRVTVRDSGSGMDAATQARLFEPFFTTKERGQGTGLGLPMVYGFVRQSGGFITVESAPGKGTAFALHFPRVSAPLTPNLPAVADADVDQDDELPSETGTILVVEDQWPVRWLLAHTLREVGYTVIDSVDAREAIAAADKEGAVFDMLITDVVMPGMSGVELAAHVRGTRPRIPVLFISGYGADELDRRGVDLHGAELLVKPFTHTQLTRTVRRMLTASSVV